MSLIQLVYSSRPFGFDDGVLYGILTQARRKNAEADITGCLVCRADIYLQLLEGPEAAVRSTYAHIVRDQRHDEVARHIDQPVDQRRFPDWAMKDDPARSWLWTPQEVAAGALAKATPEAILRVFDLVAAESA